MAESKAADGELLVSPSSLVDRFFAFCMSRCVPPPRSRHMHRHACAGSAADTRGPWQQRGERGACWGSSLCAR
jgi:hypothetical protein